jgi:hypothetical protein
MLYGVIECLAGNYISFTKNCIAMDEKKNTHFPGYRPVCCADNSPVSESEYLFIDCFLIRISINIMAISGKYKL